MTKKRKIDNGLYEYKGFVLKRYGNHGWNYYWDIYGRGYVENKHSEKLIELRKNENVYKLLGNRYFTDVLNLKELMAQIDTLENTEYLKEYKYILNEYYYNPFSEEANRYDRGTNFKQFIKDSLENLK